MNDFRYVIKKTYEDKTGPPRTNFTNFRCRKMHWQTEGNWHWSIVFTDACKCLQPTWARADVFGNMHLNVLNILRTFIGSNNEPNGPNV